MAIIDNSKAFIAFWLNSYCEIKPEVKDNVLSYK